MVMIGHLRSFLFVAPGEVDNISLVDKLFYFVTGFGREAVVTFFVLSGFFITKSIVGMVERNDWSWHSSYKQTGTTMDSVDSGFTSNIDVGPAGHQSDRQRVLCR